MVAAHRFPHGHGRDDALCLLFLVYYGRDGARTSRRSHHGHDRLGKLKNTSLHRSSWPREGKMSAVAVTATVTGVTMVAWHYHGRD